MLTCLSCSSASSGGPFLGHFSSLVRALYLCTFVLSSYEAKQASRQARARGRLSITRDPREGAAAACCYLLYSGCAGSRPSCAEGDELEPVIIALSKHPNVQCSKRHPKYESALWTNAQACLRYCIHTAAGCWLLASSFQLMRRVFRALDLRATGQYAP